jgi:signal transduction histidine kinase
MAIYTGYALLLILAVTGVLITLQQRTLGRSFQVFEQLRRNMEQIRNQQFNRSGINPPVEIMPLVEEIERLVQQLRSRIERTRHSISNLAHELKRPIQLLTIQQEDNALLTEPLNQIRSIVDRELRRARISGSQSSSVDFNPVEELRNLVQVMNTIYPAVRIDILSEDRGVSLRLDRDDMLELIGNIIDNSCKYAANRVRVSVEFNGDQLIMVFEDDGSGLDQSQIERIRLRGVRLDESRDGHGIGLGLCQDIVDSYHGEIQYTRGELGGLRVTLCIPRGGKA